MNPPLFQHQKEGIQFVLDKGGSAALFHSIGLGKTRTALESFAELRKHNPGLKLFVFCPVSLIESAWGEDIKKYTQFSYWNLNKDKRYPAGLKSYDIYLMNYEKIIRDKWAQLIIDLAKTYSFMAVLDESSKIKNHDSKVTKTLLALRHLFQFRVILSGTPAPNDETEYWAQISFVNGNVFPPKFHGFRHTYFYFGRQRRNGIETFNGKIMSKEQARQLFESGYQWMITPQRREHLMQRMSPITHWRRKEECLPDLPEKIDQIRKVQMTEDQSKAYRQMERDYITEIKGQAVTAEVALAKIMKLRQITSGFLLNEKAEAINIMSESPKLKELLSVLEEAGNQQAIIWGVFRHEIQTIKAALGDRAVTLYGETKDKDLAINQFKSGQVQYLIAHPRTAGHGLTLVNASLEIFFSLDYSWETYEQARGRIHRPGQKSTCLYIHLLAEDTIDEDVLEVLQHKKQAVEIVYKLLGGK